MEASTRKYPRARIVLQPAIDTRIRGRQDADSPYLPRLLGLGGERHGEHGSQASNEGATVHLFNNLIRP
jgi:hypothetical protein